MKVFKIIAAVVVALAAVAGIVYVVATYGDKIVAWARKLLKKPSKSCCDDCECNEDGECICGDWEDDEDDEDSEEDNFEE